MNWSLYYYLGPLSVVFFLIGAALVLKKPEKAELFTLLGALVTLVFIVLLWIGLSRPPFRTMGETRLWYSFFLSAGGFVAFRRFGYRFLLSFGAVMASIFAMINVFKPEIHSKALMPALQSPYFIPHVTLYILSYAILAAAALGSVLILMKRGKTAKSRAEIISQGPLESPLESPLDIPLESPLETPLETQDGGGDKNFGKEPNKEGDAPNNAIHANIPSKDLKKESDKGLYDLVDNLVYAGTGFLMLGLILGALWAKEAWGHYWSWDPKETWAFVTAAAFLLYIHLRKFQSKSAAPLFILPLAFVFLMITWLGVSFLPTANLSVHVY
jgi:cytochrome c-type biogenesis protein CcsB